MSTNQLTFLNRIYLYLSFETANFANVNQTTTLKTDSNMNDKIKELERQLSEARAEERLHNKISQARCPLCGAKLSYTAEDVSSSEYGDYTTSAEIRCTHCKCFGYREELRQNSWHSTNVKPLELLKTVWGHVSRYADSK